MRAAELNAQGQATLFAATGVEVKRATKKPAQSKEELFAFQCRAMKLPPVLRNYQFAQSMGRRWRFDFAFITHNVAVEIEGLTVRRIGGELVCTGRHASIEGFKGDCTKYASAALLGWTVLRFEQSQVKAGLAIDMTQRLLFARGWVSG
jgi:very-short-patch-repair endonuclease